MALYDLKKENVGYITVWKTQKSEYMYYSCLYERPAIHSASIVLHRYIEGILRLKALLASPHLFSWSHTLTFLWPFSVGAFPIRSTNFVTQAHLLTHIFPPFTSKAKRAIFLFSGKNCYGTFNINSWFSKSLFELIKPMYKLYLTSYLIGASLIFIIQYLIYIFIEGVTCHCLQNFAV